MYRWLEELGGGYAKEIETEAKNGSGELPQNDEEAATLVRRRKKFSANFKASVLAAYTRVGPVQTARQFGVSEGLVMQWRRKAGVTKFTDLNDVTVKGENRQDGDLAKSIISEEKQRKLSSRKGLKKPFYSAELRSEVLSYYR